MKIAAQAPNPYPGYIIPSCQLYIKGLFQNQKVFTIYLLHMRVSRIMPTVSSVIKCVCLAVSFRG